MPAKDWDLKRIDAGIRALQSAAEGLLSSSEDFPALNRNLRRIQAGIKMLELDICDLLDLDKLSKG